MRRDKSIGPFLKLLFIAAGVIINSAVAEAVSNKTPVLIADLSGASEIPKINTDARGHAEFRLSDDGRELTYKLEVSGIEKINAAHIHLAPVDEDGPVVVVLFDFTEPWASRIRSTVTEGVITRDNLVGPLVGAPLSTLIREMAGGYTYINIHTDDYPVGHIRGQIIDPVTLQD